MGFYEDFENYQSRGSKKSFWPYFLTGMIGVLAGGLLLIAVLSWGGWLSERESLPPSSNENHEQEESRQEETPLPPPQEHQDTDIVNAAERVAPAVVGVSNYRYVQSGGERALIEQGTGSGVVVSPDGLIVTNQHVINNAEEIKIIFQDREVKTASVVGEDVETDLAVLEIETEGNLEYAELTETKRLHPGETAIAIGNPLGLAFQQTVTVGVVSATERQVRIPESDYNYTFLQTDAAINEGNSGGPLINIKGEIIGINSAKVLDPRVEGIGFAIPATTVERVTRDLVEQGRVIRPHMGVGIEDYSDVTGATADTGVYVQIVEPASPAAEAGIKEGDIIVEIEEDQINYYAQLFDALLNYYPGDEIEITVIREEEKQSLEVELGEDPER